MHQYTCPSCEAVLKRQEPLPAGKKLRCPKCETVFDPAPTKITTKPKAAAATPAPGAKKAYVDDDDDRNPYTVMKEVDEDEKMKAEKERAAQGLIRDRFKKSARGPATKEVVRPANFMLGAGVFVCVVALVGFLIGLFPLVFQDFYSQQTKPPPGMKYAEWEEKRKQNNVKMSPEEWNALVIQSSILMGASVFYFALGGVICTGAFKMRTLESLTWAWIGTIVCLAAGGILLIIGIWCMLTLNNPIVKAGFAEEKPPDV